MIYDLFGLIEFLFLVMRVSTDLACGMNYPSVACICTNNLAGGFLIMHMCIKRA